MLLTDCWTDEESVEMVPLRNVPIFSAASANLLTIWLLCSWDDCDIPDMTSLTSAMAALIALVAKVICSCICCMAVELALAEVWEISETAFFTSSIVTCRVEEIWAILFGKSAIDCAAVPSWWASVSNSLVAEPDRPELNSFIISDMLFFNSSTTVWIMSVAGDDTCEAIWSICSTMAFVVASTFSIRGRIFCCIWRESTSSKPLFNSIARSVENDFNAFDCSWFSFKISLMALAIVVASPDSLL